MKRKFFYLAASALLLTGCASEDVLDEVNQDLNVIGFENVVNKPTRADLTTGTLEKFHVFGFYVTPSANNVAVQVFNDVPVTWNSSKSAWEYEGEKRYWLEGEKYYFYAYSCGNVSKLDTDNFGKFSMRMDDNLIAEERALKIKGYICDNTHQHDLIYASNTGENYGGILGQEKGKNSKVTFQFNHILSKVRARFTSLFPEDYVVKISDVRIDNICNQGDFNPNAVEGWVDVKRRNNERALVNLETKTTVTNEEDESVTEYNYVSTTAATAPVFSEYAYVLPKTYQASDGTVTLAFHVVVENKGQVVLNKDMYGRFTPNWLKGNTYYYDVKLDGAAADLEAIVFETVTDATGAVINWMTETDVDFTIDKD